MKGNIWTIFPWIPLLSYKRRVVALPEAQQMGPRETWNTRKGREAPIARSLISRHRNYKLLAVQLVSSNIIQPYSQSFHPFQTEKKQWSAMHTIYCNSYRVCRKAPLKERASQKIDLFLSATKEDELWLRNRRIQDAGLPVQIPPRPKFLEPKASANQR